MYIDVDMSRPDQIHNLQSRIVLQTAAINFLKMKNPNLLYKWFIRLCARYVRINAMVETEHSPPVLEFWPHVLISGAYCDVTKDGEVFIPVMTTNTRIGKAIEILEKDTMHLQTLLAE